MILALQVPFLETFARGGQVVTWHVREGEAVQFGDPICDISLSQWMALRKTKRAINLARVGEKRKSKVRNDFELREDRGVLVMRVVASENGFLRQIIAGEGQSVVVDDLLGVFSTVPDEQLPLDPAGAPSMRVVATSSDVKEEMT